MKTNSRWNDDSIQFPRLLAELCATGALTPAVYDQLRELTDLTNREINEILTRAQCRWEAIKFETCPPGWPAWVERHSVNCYRCGEMVDERLCVPNTSEHGGNSDGGSLCPGCVEALKPVWAITCEGDNNLMWCNENGWVDGPEFDTFTEGEKDRLHLPIEGRWVRVGS